MSNIKVLFITPNPRTMSLVSPTISLFYGIFKSNGIDMKFFDTTSYDVSDEFTDPDKYKQANLAVCNFESGFGPHKVVFKKRDELFSDFKREAGEWKPDIIIASAMESTFIFTIEILRAVREFGIPHVLGGVFATFAPDIAIKYDEIDILCVGEGENVIVPLCRGLTRGENIRNIPNLWIKEKNGDVHKSPLAPPIELDKNPRFDASIFSDHRFYRAMAGRVYRMFPVETHRGCPFQCAFCNSPLQEKKYRELTDSRYFRKKSIGKVMEDIRYFVDECGAEYFFFWADNFFAYSKKEIDEFCEAYKDIRIPFYAQAHPASLDEYKILKLKEVGLNRVGIGIEHGNEKFRCDVVNRWYSNELAIKQIGLLSKYSIQFSCNNIVGFPDETPELHMDTVKLNRILRPHTSSISIFTPFYGTPLRELAIQKGYLKDKDFIAPTNTEESILEMPQFTKDQISGKARTFNLYVRFPEERWGDIKKAEVFTPEGDRMWLELKREYAEKYSEKLITEDSLA